MKYLLSILACFLLITCEAESTNPLTIRIEIAELDMYNQRCLLYPLKSGKLFVTAQKPYIIDIETGEVTELDYEITGRSLSYDASGNGPVYTFDPLVIFENSGEGYSYHMDLSTQKKIVLYTVDHRYNNITVKEIEMDPVTHLRFASRKLYHLDDGFLLHRYISDGDTKYIVVNQDFELVSEIILDASFAFQISEYLYVCLINQQPASEGLDEPRSIWNIGIYNSKTDTVTIISDKKVFGVEVYGPTSADHMFQVFPEQKKVVFVSDIGATINKDGFWDWSMELTVISYEQYLVDTP